MVSLFQVKAIDTVELFIRSVCNMGSYLNPGSVSFRNSLRPKIYVDKSELIARTNEQSRDMYVSATRDDLESLWRLICLLHIMRKKKTAMICLAVCGSAEQSHIETI